MNSLNLKNLGLMHQGLSLYHLPILDMNGFTTMEEWKNGALNTHPQAIMVENLKLVIQDMMELVVDNLNLVIMELVCMTQKHMRVVDLTV